LKKKSLRDFYQTEFNSADVNQKNAKVKLEQETRDFFRAVNERKDAFDDLEKEEINLENNVGSSGGVNRYQRLYSEAVQNTMKPKPICKARKQILIQSSVTS
jgi:hypothetical protein